MEEKEIARTWKGVIMLEEQSHWIDYRKIGVCNQVCILVRYIMRNRVVEMLARRMVISSFLREDTSL